MKLHLVDGTYELFRSYFGAPPAKGAGGREVGATRGLVRSLLKLLREEGGTHVGVAFDTRIESFRNELFAGYKTGDGIDPELFQQFELAERATRALGLTVWPMLDFEADDALATVAARAEADPRVEQVLICSPDKDLAQCVRGQRVCLVDRRRGLELDEAAVFEKWGVPPAAIPDWLALVGDDADGIPGVPRWGAKSAAVVLAAHGHLEDIPPDPARWKVKVRGAQALSESLEQHREAARLYRTLATLRTDAPIAEALAELAWGGAPRAELEALAAELGDTELPARVHRFREG